MKVAFWIWTALVLIGVGLMLANDIGDRVYAGTDLTLKADTARTLTIDAASNITLQAGSPDFFLLRKLSGETIAGKPTEPPLGMDSKTYFVAGPIQIQGGQWLVDNGDTTLRLTSDGKITVTAIVTGKEMAGEIAVDLFLGFIVWIVVVAFVALLAHIDD